MSEQRAMTWGDVRAFMEANNVADETELTVEALEGGPSGEVITTSVLTVGVEVISNGHQIVTIRTE